MEYNLWDVEAGKQLGHFTNEKDALTLVKKLVNHYGEDYAGELGLGRRSDNGTILEPLSGAALLARVNEVFPDLTFADERRAAAIG